MHSFKDIARAISGLLLFGIACWIYYQKHNSNLFNNIYTQTKHIKLNSRKLENLTDCGQLTQAVKDQYFWSSEEELEFPIAYAIATYASFERLARLLRLIYRKHNVHCIHMDRKALPAFKKKVTHLANCYGSNVILLPPELSVDVRWGYFSVLQAPLLCAEQLIRQNQFDWRYLLNINEKELPLRTNWELVRALKNYNGSNVVGGFDGNQFRERLPLKQFTFLFRWVKASMLVALRREFVKFMLTEPRAVDILEALKAEQRLKKVQDELFFSTLAYNPHLGAPGACLFMPKINQSDPRTWVLARYVNWNWRNCPSVLSVHGICILGWKDIPMLMNQPHFFANKFLPDFEPEAYTHMERLYVNKVLSEQEYQVLDPNFDERIYANWHCSRYHI